MNQTNSNMIAFGTGGIRGIMGLEANHINEQTIKCVIQGFSNYINVTNNAQPQRAVAIAYDSRHNSDIFAKIAAGVFAHNNIPVFIFEELDTTPMLSFAIRHLGCIGGICITASHNPPEYNGIKIYWSDGAQIVSPQDTEILAYIQNIPLHSDIALTNFSHGLTSGTITYIHQDVHNAYFQTILKTLPNNSANIPSSANEDLSIVYTPLHGTGGKPVTKLLEYLAVKNFFIVPEQEKPDGHFPTVKKPNPEDPESLTLAIQYATARNADVIFATDPDSDRLAICIKDPARAKGAFKSQAKGDYILLNGNQTGALFLNFILSSMQKNGVLHTQHKVIKTLVTSNLLSQVCQSYGVEIFNTPTGFKWVSKYIREWETDTPEYKFLFGAEESFGYMFANNVRDKDAIAALACAVQMISFYKKQSLTLCDALFDLFQKFGVWQEDLMCFDFEPNSNGMNKITKIMDRFRQTSHVTLGGIPVVHTIDYLLTRAEEKSSLFPKLNFLQFILSDNTQVSVRPSGTEPKLKIYFSVCTAHSDINIALKQTHDKIQRLRYEMLTLVQ